MLQIDGDHPSVPPPDRIGQPQIRQALSDWQTARQRLVDARRELRQLEHQAPAAREQDAEDLAGAIQEGGKDPGPRHLAAHEKNLAGLQRTIRAAEILATKATGTLRQSAEQHAGAWVAQIDEDRAKARAEYTGLLDQLEEVHQRLGELESTRAFATGNSRYATGKRLAWFPIDRRPEDARVTVADAITGLRSLAQDPEPRQQLRAVEAEDEAAA